MKTLILLALLAAPMTLMAADSTAIAYGGTNIGVPVDDDDLETTKATYPAFKIQCDEYEADPNSWRFDFQEYVKIKTGWVSMPEYYESPIHGSNGGYSIG